MHSYKQFAGCGLAVLLIVCGNGCGSSSSSGGSGRDEMADAIAADNAARKQQESADAAKTAEAQKAAAAAAAQNPPEPERKAVGSRPPMEGGGYFAAIGSARRTARNFADNIAWIQGVRSFKAEEGRKPKDTAEFMKVVVPRYELQLPKLEEDEEYYYDPNGETDGDFGKLYVAKKQTPAEAAAAASSQPSGAAGTAAPQK